MADELKNLLDSDVLSESVKAELLESWERKVEEIKEQATAEIRDEFATKYNKDKSEIVEAMNAMIQDILTSVTEELNIEKQALVAEQVRYKKAVREHTESFNKFSTQVLGQEITEFRKDRKTIAENFVKMNSFVQSQVSLVLEDFHNEKRRIADEQVHLRLVAKKELQETKAKLVKEQARLASDFISKIVTEEITQLKDELKEAKETNLGRKIYESVISEVRSNFFNENKEVKKLVNAIKERDLKLEESKKEIESKNRKLEESASQVRVAKEKLERTKVLNELLSPLGNEKRAIMEEMLEKQPTTRLRESFERLLPTVMEDSSNVKSKIITEGNYKEVTGNRKNIISESVNAKEQEIIASYVNTFKSIS